MIEVHPGIYVSSTATHEWEPDPEVGGEMHVLVKGEGAVGDMASLPKGVTTTWHLTLPFRELWFFGRPYDGASE